MRTGRYAWRRRERRGGEDAASRASSSSSLPRTAAPSLHTRFRILFEPLPCRKCMKRSCAGEGRERVGEGERRRMRASSGTVAVSLLLTARAGKCVAAHLGAATRRQSSLTRCYLPRSTGSTRAVAHTPGCTAVCAHSSISLSCSKSAALRRSTTLCISSAHADTARNRPPSMPGRAIRYAVDGRGSSRTSAAVHHHRDRPSACIRLQPDLKSGVDHHVAMAHR